MLPLENRKSKIEDRRSNSHWPEIARQWDLVGSPLRPSAQDVEIYSALLGEWVSTYGAPRALILGVTPELYHLPWPNGTDLSAIDRTPHMIDALWPGPPAAVVRADWTDMPLPSGSRDTIFCDGGLHLLSHPRDHHRLVWALQRITVPNGVCVFRLFVPPNPRESPAAVLGELLAGRIPNPNVLKLRLGMALQKDSERGVRLGDVWDALHRVAPDLGRLADRIGWQLEPLLAINTYRDCSTCYHFVSVAQARRFFCEQPGGFAFAGIHVPDYPLGERCPIVVFRRAGGAAA